MKSMVTRPTFRITLIVLVAFATGCVSTNTWLPSLDTVPPSNDALVESPPEAVSPRTTTDSSEQIKLASANQARESDADITAQAGKDFERPPAIPEAPAAIAENQNAFPNGQPLSLEMLESLACNNNPTLLQAQGQIQGELGKAVQAGLWPNPRLSYVQEQIGVENTVGEFVGGTISQRIVTGHKLDLSRAKFLARTKAAQWHALEQQYRVLNDVRIHYFRAQGREQLVQIHRDLLKSAEDNALTQRERFNVGQATRADVHLANVSLQRSRLDLLRAENEYREAFEALTAMVGVELPLAPLVTPLEGDLTPIDYEQALYRLTDESPQILAARSKLESDRIKMRREIVEPIPDLIVEGGVGHNFEASQTVGSARISAEIPLFDWNQGTIRQAEADYAQQQGEVRRIELTLKQQLAQTYRDYLTSLQHAKNYAEVILPEARAAYELQLLSYRDDRITWNEVLRTQETYFMLRAEYIRNLIGWRESEIMIKGFLLHGGLEAPSSPPPPGHIDAVPRPR